MFMISSISILYSYDFRALQDVINKKTFTLVKKFVLWI